MTRRVLLVLALALLLPAAGVFAADAPRSLPFNKQNVYNYFKQVDEGKRALPEPEADDTATCACRRALDGLPLPFELP